MTNNSYIHNKYAYSKYSVVSVTTKYSLFPNAIQRGVSIFFKYAIDNKIVTTIDLPYNKKTLLKNTEKNMKENGKIHSHSYLIGAFINTRTVIKIPVINTKESDTILLIELYK